MERDALLAHGAAYLLHDRLHTCSDYTVMQVCSACGSLLSPNQFIPTATVADMPRHPGGKRLINQAQNGSNLYQSDKSLIHNFKPHSSVSWMLARGLCSHAAALLLSSMLRHNDLSDVSSEALMFRAYMYWMHVTFTESPLLLRAYRFHCFAASFCRFRQKRADHLQSLRDRQVSGEGCAPLCFQIPEHRAGSNEHQVHTVSSVLKCCCIGCPPTWWSLMRAATLLKCRVGHV